MGNRHEEWLKQSNYDIDTADTMYNSGRYFYTVFMCHLSIEKGLKGLYDKILCQVPPKTHNLTYLLNQIGKRPNPEMEQFITKLDTASVAARYPDDLDKIQAEYTQEKTKEILAKSKGVLLWIKAQF